MTHTQHVSPKGIASENKFGGQPVSASPSEQAQRLVAARQDEIQRIQKLEAKRSRLVQEIDEQIALAHKTSLEIEAELNALKG